MRRIFAAAFVLVLILVLGVAPNATADHTTDACHSSALIATDTMGTMCPLILHCPASAPATCSWDLTVSAQGIGHVRARAVNLETGQTLVTCGQELLECSATAPFHLSPPTVLNIECFLFGGESHPALLATLECTAAAAGHVG